MFSLSDLIAFTRADQPGSIFVRAGIWLVGILIIAVGVEKNHDDRHLRADAGWFFMFLLGAGILSYFLFGFAPTF